ncbi:SNF2 family N-terminal domain-domain-containing protein [Kockovaella imperatae]|uniref:Helicase SWR1 n=1 Tax=Kockovaella imperatae TaxID=4999 RepID=A0A1Y1UF19_9TREE|nr:SNF2 family N-terminal domain-domain-containing protein [Kockovaella imperatae]ORX35665.1 SNF2 family N-terminal domain-domain-containing protein [Kockovaella imperatae]
MEVDPVAGPSVAQEIQNASSGHVDGIATVALAPKTPAKTTATSRRSLGRGPLPTRTLRARPSDPVSYAPPSRPVQSSAITAREPDEVEIESIRRKLGEDGIKERREELIKEKEAIVKQVVESHDAAVREKFHLERYISLLEGYDPEFIKSDNSPVFLEYARNNYDLLSLLPLDPTTQVAGPSKRPRSSLPARQTRRQAHEQSELLAHVVSTPVNGAEKASSRGKEKARGTPDVKGKGKAKAVVEEQEPIPVEPDAKVIAVTHTGKRKGRASILVDSDIEASPVPFKGKKTRASLLSEQILAERLKEESVPPSTSQDTSAPATPRPPSEPPEPPRPPTPLPSLAHIPFPPAPLRPKERIFGPREPWYTMPIHKPPPPKFGGDIAPIMDSYIHIEDTNTPPLKVLEQQAARDGYLVNRVNWLQHQGRLGRLLEESGHTLKTRPPALPPRKTDFRDSLMAHMVQVRNAMLNEAKQKPVVAKRIARMIQAYWEHIEGREERERAAEERERKKKMKDLIRAMRKRWNLAVKIIRARIQAAQKLEQDRLGKEHLQNMLQRSTGLLEAQRDDIAGDREVEDGEEDQGSADEDSDAETEEVSAAEDEDEDEDEASDDGSDVPEEAADSDAEVEEEAEDEEDDKDAIQTDSDTPVPGLRDLLADDEALDGMEIEQEDVPVPPERIEDVDTAQAETSLAIDTPLLDLDATDVRPGQVETLTTAQIQLPQPDVMYSPLDGRSHLQPRSSLSASLRTPDSESGAQANGTSRNETIAELPQDPVEPTISASITPDAESRSTNGTADHQIAIPIPAVSTEIAFALQPPSNPPESDVIQTVSTSVNEEILTTEDEPVLARPRRQRKALSHADLFKTEDPDANDTEFVAVDSDVDHRDAEMDVEMEEAEDEDEGEDDEDAGLMADADLPIEELLRRYGYPVEALGTEQSPAIQETGQIITDKSLLDENLSGESPKLIVEGKRQRRVRSVWTPEETPQHMPSKRPKIEEVEDQSDYEMTPSVSESEEEEAESDEEEAKNEDVNRLQAPFLLRGTLRPYQHAGLEWLASLYQNNMNGILADEMGLGKTIQTISLLAHLACDKGVWGQHLIIVPTSVILNWEMEFKKFLPGMKVLTYYGNQKERKDKRVGWNTENAWQVCITSYQIVLADQHIFRRKSWVYMILDEAHNIKNFRSQRWQTLLGFKAQRRLLLTGTPLQNNLMELWSLLYFLMPNGVTADATAVVGFANHKEFTEWFSNPMDKAVESGDILDSDTLETVAKLHTLLRPFILRRLKSEVETQLPGKFEHVVYCKLSKRQRFLYDEFMSRSSTKEALTSGGYLGVVNTLMQLRKVCNHPDLFEVRPVRTSFAMERSVLADFEPSEILVRKRLLRDMDYLDQPAFKITAFENASSWTMESRRRLDASDLLPHAIEPVKKGKSAPTPPMDTRTVEGWLQYRSFWEETQSVNRWRALRDINRRRCHIRPIYGSTLLSFLSNLSRPLAPGDMNHRSRLDSLDDFTPPAARLVHSYEERAKLVAPLVDIFALMPPLVVAKDMTEYALPGLKPTSTPEFLEPSFDTLHQASVKLQIAFPDASLLQYDCGKLQKLYEMLRDLKAEGHRVLIFTQMTRVLDILETFLSYNGHRYLRLDGSTKIEDRQIITERFNSDARIFCFIASSRSGGVGINLTGADTVFFYDSDWNPSMDRQCMDRAHRIGQTREVHIYRFVSSHTVEENMLKKANQKRLLDRVVIQEGEFTTDFFGKMDWRDVLDAEVGNGKTAAAAAGAGAPPGDDLEDERIQDIEVEPEPEAVDAEASAPRLGEERAFAKALAEVEDEEDAAAARVAQGEGELDFVEFEDATRGKAGGTTSTTTATKRNVSFVNPRGSSTPLASGPMDGDDAADDVKDAEVGDENEDEEEEEEEDDDDGIGAVDEYMLRTRSPMSNAMHHYRARESNADQGSVTDDDHARSSSRCCCC